MTCYQPIYGCAIDGVLLDQCGKPVVGDSSYFCITDKLIKVDFTPDVFTPAEITVENAKGNRCVTKKPCPQLQGYDLNIEVCGLLPAIESALSGNRPLSNDAGETTGVVHGKREECPPKWALRIWQETDTDECTDEGDPEYVVHWFSGVSNLFQTGTYSIENGTSAWTFEGYAEANPEFGMGPFSDFPTAWFDEEIYAYDLTPTPPPECENPCELTPYPVP